MEVLILLERDRGATHLGGQYHFGARGDLAGQGAHDDFRGGRRCDGGPRGCDGGSGHSLFLFQTLLERDEE